MKQILQNARSGDLEIVDVPAPMTLPGVTRSPTATAISERWPETVK